MRKFRSKTWVLLLVFTLVIAGLVPSSMGKAYANEETTTEGTNTGDLTQEVKQPVGQGIEGTTDTTEPGDASDPKDTKDPMNPENQGDQTNQIPPQLPEVIEDETNQEGEGALLLIPMSIAPAPQVQSTVSSKEIEGNKSGKTLTNSDIKVDPPDSGTYYSKDSTNNVTVTFSEDGKTVDWQSNNPVKFVWVKGGNGGFLYTYSLASTSGSGLFAPDNRGENRPKISHVIFYFGEGSEQPSYDYITVKKVNLDGSSPENITFKLKDIDGEIIEKLTDSQGKIVFGPLPVNESYKLSEVVPKGYMTDLEKDKAVTVGETIEVRNTKMLKLTPMCTDKPGELRWRVRNTNSVAVDFTWDIYKTKQLGASTAPASSDIYFYSTKQERDNTARIFVNGIQNDVKAANYNLCENPLMQEFTVKKIVVDKEDKVINDDKTFTVEFIKDIHRRYSIEVMNGKTNPSVEIKSTSPGAISLPFGDIYVPVEYIDDKNYELVGFYFEEDKEGYPEKELPIYPGDSHSTIVVVNRKLGSNIPENPPGDPGTPSNPDRPERDRPDPPTLTVTPPIVIDSEEVPAGPVPEAPPVVEEPPVVIEEEEIPAAPILPKTGEIPPALFYGIGTIATALGLTMRRKKKIR